MSYENTGRLFKVDNKKSDKHPDYTGDFVDADGTKMYVAAWVQPGKGDKPNWLSFKISPKQEDTTPKNKEDAF